MFCMNAEIILSHRVRYCCTQVGVVFDKGLFGAIYLKVGIRCLVVDVGQVRVAVGANSTLIDHHTDIDSHLSR